MIGWLLTSWLIDKLSDQPTDWLIDLLIEIEWVIDWLIVNQGKTLIQKYECINESKQEYKNVNTYSGWTQATR